MQLKKYLDFRLLGLIGSILMILSEFLPWFSGLSLMEVYIFMTAIAMEHAFLYFFPVVSGIICIFASILNLYKQEYRINAVIIYFVGLGFMFLFFIELIPNELNYLSNVGIGFYFCVAGFLLVLIDIINILMTKD